MSILYLPQVDSTNNYAKEHYNELADGAAVYTANQTAGRGRRGHVWENAAGLGLYYTVVLKRPLAQPSTLPLAASLAVRDLLRREYGVECQIKWPNDLLLNGKKFVGILCESIEGADGSRGILCGIGINLAQPQSYFDGANLPYGTSLALQGVAVDAAADLERIAGSLTETGFGVEFEAYARGGFAACCSQYKAACVNLGRPVAFEGGVGTATDVDETGSLVVQTGTGEQRVFTGEVSVHGVYGVV